MGFSEGVVHILMHANSLKALLTFALYNLQIIEYGREMASSMQSGFTEAKF